MKYTNNTIRINFLFVICIVLLFCVFFGKLYYVTFNDVVEGTNLQELADSRATATKILKAERGNILDREGNLLAQNVNSYTVIAYLSPSRTSDERYPKHVVDKDLTATKLSEILLPINEKMTKEYIYGLLGFDGYQVELGPGGRNITELTKQKIEELNLPGIDFIKTSKRYYQNGDFASYIIGYAKKYDGSEEMIGELGIEGFCNRYLKGTDGSITYQKDAYGYQMANTVSYETPAKDGLDVYLTLDKQVQIFLDNSVEEFVKYNPDWVSITIADAKTGAIIGSSSSPSFNPNKLNIVNYNNPFTSYTYEPGSTMKIFSFMSAMEEGAYKGDELYQSGTVPVKDYIIKDWNKVGWGKITYDVGFTYSSNVAAVKLAQKIGRNKLSDYYSRLGFGEQTGIELANEYNGKIDIEYETELASASYGHGITVTPVQMIQALTSVTNDGTTLKPYIIDKIIDPNTGKVVYEGKRTEKNKVYSTATVNKITELMDMTVNGNDSAATGKVYETPSVRLIGKTGTANYIGENGKYVVGSYNVIRSFAGVFPKDNPEYIIYVVVKDFHGTSKNMGAIVKDLVESVAKYKNLDERVSDKDESKIVKVDNYLNTSLSSATTKINNKGMSPIIIGNGNTVVKQMPERNTKISSSSKIFLLTNGNEYVYPDVTGWSSSELITFCNLVGIKYELNGYGYVVSTNIVPGAIINKEDVITANLENIQPSSLIKPKVDEQNDKDKKTS